MCLKLGRASFAHRAALLFQIPKLLLAPLAANLKHEGASGKARRGVGGGVCTASLFSTLSGYRLTSGTLRSIFLFLIGKQQSQE